MTRNNIEIEQARKHVVEIIARLIKKHYLNELNKEIKIERQNKARIK